MNIKSIESFNLDQQILMSVLGNDKRTPVYGQF